MCGKKRGMLGVVVGFAVFCAVFALFGGVKTYASAGVMGFFGGVTEGERLPKTTEIILALTAKKNTSLSKVFAYKELIFLGGEPVEATGQLTVRISGTQEQDAAGSYRVTYTIAPTASSDPDIVLNRSISFTVDYRWDNGQLVEDYKLTDWTEQITLGGDVYVLDGSQSYFGVSFLTDITAGVTYYKGNTSVKSVYTFGEARVELETYGSIYGYESAWSNTEVQTMDSAVYREDWQLQYQTRASVSANKILQYSRNAPSVISFAGNYQEVMQRQSGIAYDIFVLPNQFYGAPMSGSISFSSPNDFEQLTTKDTAFLTGHWAEEDIAKLFAMNILEGEPAYFLPDQAITRGQFVSMLVKAIKLAIEPVPEQKGKKEAPLNLVFPDVSQERPDYPYIMAAFKAGISVGRGNGLFYPDATLELEEAIVMIVKALGLSSLGLEPTMLTLYSDNDSISDWARKDIFAATRMGLILPDENGRINPRANVSKALGAALINRTIEYMRTSLADDYTNHIVPYTN